MFPFQEDSMVSFLSIDVYSDVICPWCYLGKKRLEMALAEWDGGPVQIRFLPYELNPSTPEEGIDHHAYLASKMGSEKALEAAHARLADLGKEVGLHYRFDLVKKIPNTFQAHRVLWFAEKEGKDRELHDAFFKAYFTDGKDLTQAGTLVELAGSVGLDKAKVEAFLKSDEGGKEVKESEEKAYDLGVTGVPFFVFNNQFAVSGAQPVSAFKQALLQSQQA
jgi:predicted DsbA family dithiol-disulfide isomerase